MTSLRLAPWALSLALVYATPVQAAVPADAIPQLKGLNANDAQLVVAKLVEGQRAVKARDKVYFELLSGAPATYDATLVPPRQAFLGMHFERPDVVERLEAPNSLWHPYRLTYFAKKGSELMWEVEVVLGFEEQLERVQMLYKPPPPF